MWFLLKLFTLVATSLLLHNACNDNYFYNRFLLSQASVGELTQSVTVAYENESQPLHYDFQIVVKPPVIASSLPSASTYVKPPVITSSSAHNNVKLPITSSSAHNNVKLPVTSSSAHNNVILSDQTHDVKSYKTVKWRVTDNNQFTTKSHVLRPAANCQPDSITMVNKHFILDFKPNINTAMVIYKPVLQSKRYISTVARQSIAKNNYFNSAVNIERIDTSVVVYEANIDNFVSKSTVETSLVVEQPIHQTAVETPPVIEQPIHQTAVETSLVIEQSIHQTAVETSLVIEQPIHQTAVETSLVIEQPIHQTAVETSLVIEQPIHQTAVQTSLVNEQPIHQTAVETSLVNEQPIHQTAVETSLVIEQPIHQTAVETSLVVEQPIHQTAVETSLVNEQPIHQTAVETSLVNEQTIHQTNVKTSLVIEQSNCIQSAVETTLVNEQPRIQSNKEITVVDEQPSIQPAEETTLVNEQPRIRSNKEITVANEQPRIQSDVETTLVNEQPSIQPDEKTTLVNRQHIHQTTNDTGLSNNQEPGAGISLSKEYEENEDIHKNINNDKETTSCLHDQLKFYLPSYIYNELISEYHLINQDYEQRQLNDSTKATWKQIINIYLRKIKLFTRQVNSLLLKLTSHVYNYTKLTAVTCISSAGDTLKNLLDVVDGCIRCLYVTVKVVLKSMDIKFRDGFYLAAFLLTVNEMKKSHKNQLDVLSKCYDKEMESLQSLLKEQTSEQQQQMKETREESEKDRIRSGKVMLEQTKKIETLLSKMNSQPFFPPPPPPPPPSRFYTQNIPPFQRPKVKFSPFNINNIQPTLPTASSLRPSVNRQLTEQVDSLQFFGCPDNYVRPSGLKFI